MYSRYLLSQNATLAQPLTHVRARATGATFLTDVRFDAVGDRKSRDVVVEDARRELWALVNSPQRPASYTAAAMAAAIVNHLVAFDGAATPQASSGPDGGVSVEWWVSDTAIGVDVDASGNADVWIEKNDETIYEASWSAMGYNDAPLSVARKCLHEVSARVKIRAR